MTSVKSFSAYLLFSYCNGKLCLFQNLLAKNILVDSKFTCKISSWQHAIVINNVQEDSGLYTAVQVRVIATPVQVRIKAQHDCLKPVYKLLIIILSNRRTTVT